MILSALFISMLGISIIRAAPLSERAFNQSFIPIVLRPALGGLIVSAIAIITP